MPNDPEFTISGTVFGLFKKDGKDEKKALAKATVRAENKDLGTQVDQNTGDDGSYSIGPLVAGKWTLSAWSKGYKKSKPRIIDLSANRTGEDVELTRAPWSEHDQQAGERFFQQLVIALLGLAALYVILHAAVRPTERPVSAAMLTMVTEAQTQLTADVEVNQNTELAFTVAEIKGTWQVISATAQALSDQDKELATKLVAGVEGAIKSNAKDDAATNLATLHRLIDSRPGEGFLWTQDPWQVAEVFMWGLAGILVSLLMNTGTYLYQRTFWSRGIHMHISNIIGVPLMALVFVWLLSKVTMQLNLAGNQVQLALSDPRILAAVSFAIGANPWMLLRFIRETGKRLLEVGGAESESQ